MCFTQRYVNTAVFSSSYSFISIMRSEVCIMHVKKLWRWYSEWLFSGYRLAEDSYFFWLVRKHLSEYALRNMPNAWKFTGVEILLLDKIRYGYWASDIKWYQILIKSLACLMITIAIRFIDRKNLQVISVVEKLYPQRLTLKYLN